MCIIAYLVSLKRQIIRAGSSQNTKSKENRKARTAFVTKQKVNIKTTTLTIIFAITLILLGATNSKAALQANATTHKSPATKNGATWITEIRKMETAGQTMGLDETLNGLNATSEDNGIDVHMILPTEYGAVAILSASGYGNPGKLFDESDSLMRTSTGNSTGVYFTGQRWELTASYGSGLYVRNKDVQPGNISSFVTPNQWHYSGQTAGTVPGFKWNYSNVVPVSGFGPYNGYSLTIAGGRGLISSACYGTNHGGDCDSDRIVWSHGSALLPSRGSAV